MNKLLTKLLAAAGFATALSLPTSASAQPGHCFTEYFSDEYCTTCFRHGREFRYCSDYYTPYYGSYWDGGYYGGYGGHYYGRGWGGHGFYHHDNWGGGGFHHRH